MRRTEEALGQSLVSVHRFIETHAVELRTVFESGAYHRLGEVLANLRDYALNQTGGSYALRGATLKNDALRAELENLHMRPIARVAAILAMEHTEIEPLRMPSTARSTEILIAEARGMADMASKWKDAFVREGLPADFLERLQTLVEEMSESRSGRKVRWASRGGATIGIRRELATGRKLVRALDSFVLMAAGHNETLMAEWKAVKRVARPVATKRAALSAPPPMLALPAPAPTAITSTVMLAEEPVTSTPTAFWPRFLRAMSR
jgi:hypothetical protein